MVLRWCFSCLSTRMTESGHCWLRGVGGRVLMFPGQKPAWPDYGADCCWACAGAVSTVSSVSSVSSVPSWSSGPV